MLTNDNFTLEHVMKLKKNRMVDIFIDERFSAEKAAVMACKVMHMAACVLKNAPYERIDDYGLYIKTDIGNSRYSKLSKLRKFNAEGFAHIVKAVEILQE